MDKMDSLEYKIYQYLCKNHLGKKNLIKNRELREIFDVSGDKKMRKIIQNIREDKNFPMLVGSISGKRGGYYICITEKEKKETINNTRRRANQMLKACHIMEWKAKMS